MGDKLLLNLGAISELIYYYNFAMAISTSVQKWHPEARFSKAILKTPTLLFRKADLFICCKGDEN